MKSIRKHLQYYLRKVSANNIPKISTLCECILLMILKSGLVTSIMIFPFVSAMIQVPPDFEVFLIPSDIIMIVSFCWMNIVSGSETYISLWFEISFLFHSSSDLILFLKLVTFLRILLNVKSWCILKPCFPRVTWIVSSGSFYQIPFESMFINNSWSLSMLKKISMRLSLMWHSSFLFIE